MNKKITLLFLICFFSTSILSCSHTLPTSKILPRESFLYVHKILTVYSCSGDTCSSTDYNSSASAFIVKVTDQGSYAITAAHVCEDDKSFVSKEAKLSSAYEVKRLDGKKFNAVSLAYKRDIDVCLLFVNGLVEDIKPVRIAMFGPDPGDRVYNISAPRGIYAPNMVPIIEGRYNGDANGLAWYSLLAAPGSSGSMIVNKKGELVGMVHSVYIQFPVITLSTTYFHLKDFIFYNLHKYETYRKNMKLLNLKDIFTPKSID